MECCTTVFSQKLYCRPCTCPFNKKKWIFPTRFVFCRPTLNNDPRADFATNIMSTCCVQSCGCHIFVYTQRYTYMYMYTYMYIHTDMCIHLYTYVCMYVCMYICACAYMMYICVCVYIGIHFYVYLCIRSKKARKQAIKYSKPYLHTNFVCLSGELWGALRRFGEPWGTSGNSKILGNPICDPASARFFEGRQIWEVRFERTCFKGFMRSLV